jgi:hypothetical protein
MKRSLSRVVALTLYHFDDGVRKDGPPPDVRGDLSGVSGNLSDVQGDLTDVCGNPSGVCGDISGVSGDLTGVCGDIADCGLTDGDRRRGVSVEDLIALPEDETPEAAREAGEKEDGDEK